LKRAEGRILREEDVRDLDGLVQRCWVLEVKEVQTELKDRRKKKRPMAVRAWLTREQRRLPLRAELSFAFGTVRMNLVEVWNANDNKYRRFQVPDGAEEGKVE
jgi:hypothetical protein